MLIRLKKGDLRMVRVLGKMKEDSLSLEELIRRSGLSRSYGYTCYGRLKRMGILQIERDEKVTHPLRISLTPGTPYKGMSDLVPPTETTMKPGH